MTDTNRQASSGLWAYLAEWWRIFRLYVGAGRRRQTPLRNPADLQRFLGERASHMAQTSLYGYLRTRAGMRYPELFDDDVFVVSIDIAKWHVWLDCLGDLAVYAGGLLVQHQPAAEPRVAASLREIVEELLRETGDPEEAGAEFPEHARRIAQRITHCDWTRIGEGETAFSTSPASLVHWAPIVDELKQLDEEIVKNSVRYRWQEVRRELRQVLDADAMLDAMP